MIPDQRTAALAAAFRVARVAATSSSPEAYAEAVLGAAKSVMAADFYRAPARAREYFVQAGIHPKYLAGCTERLLLAASRQHAVVVMPPDDEPSTSCPEGPRTFRLSKLQRASDAKT